MTDWRRLHPGAVLFEALGALRAGALPIAVLVVAGALQGGLDAEDLLRTAGYAIAGAAAATVLGVLRWATTTWAVTAEDVRLRTGVLRRRERSVPLARVQGLDAVRAPLQRLLGVATVHVQTSGGAAEGEVVLTAVGPDELAWLHGVLGGAPSAEPEGPVRRLRTRELLLAGLTAGQAGVIVAVGGVASQVVPQLLDGAEPDQALLEHLVPDGTGGWLLLLAILLALTWAAAVAGAVATYAGFTLVRDGDRLRVRRGLLAQRESALPVGRVQAVRVVEGPLRQPLGLAAVQVETLGHGGEPPANRTLFPLLRRRDVPALLAEFLPEHADDLAGVRRVPARAWPGYVGPPAAKALVLAVPAAVLVDPVGWWALLAVVPALVLGTLRWSGAGWRLRDDGRVALRGRRLARATLLFPAERAQMSTVRQSVLQRRVALAGFRVAVGPATGAVGHLEAATAWRLWRATRPAPSAPAPAPESPAPGSR